MNEPRILSSENPVCVYPGMILDLDGTLLDSMEVWGRIDKEFLADYGIDVPPDYMEACGAMSFRETAEYTIARFSLPAKPEDLMNRWLDMAREEYAFHVQLLPGARELLENCTARACGWPSPPPHAVSISSPAFPGTVFSDSLTPSSQQTTRAAANAPLPFSNWQPGSSACRRNRAPYSRILSPQPGQPPGPAAFPSAFTKSIPPEHARRWSLSAAAISRRFLTHAVRLCCGKSHKAFAWPSTVDRNICACLWVTPSERIPSGPPQKSIAMGFLHLLRSMQKWLAAK